ncbi:putative protein kinase RLK-Pelle-L-LEC family [Helianthus annuus]|uniref:Protein kinase domain-containing protein n=1 Tax=Helianthus annuus TaxID=4232 RepID=A0A251V695_HELAN|nr:L-type lectin-domain containing receptor kinase IX.1 [Helianthus annuus]KAF5814437.1 putative protein kinase RLK-Pelle-L-LEC family [Helianthus annuus]KAJ0593052.1 putative protein kinase RLK-Pelle-L-LEC family [Helianthus annuus]KAJ0600819.1 putative protein kinase RLK-Pelle-L-LEC family [Helianthus annuus]KAJ0608066.1 putative protein kinase RLK-Pelle-L-LEC family [Helianthus annuus]KAJ0768131.1 putative protein kinase RLK-Pelle-L-LEC family [Helianthus annuus]
MGILAFFLLILIPYADSISFSMPNISRNYEGRFTFEGGAYISDDGIQVTTENNSSRVTGQVTYTERLHLWDKSSRELASFSTNFSFVKIFDQNDLYRPDDGFIFFLAQNSSVIHGANDSNAQFVWVEFDPYCNPWESSSECDHVGINVNSRASVRNLPWEYDMSSRRECQAWIRYDSASQNLSVSFTGFQNNTVFQQDGLVYTVDLRDALPEWVVFGFSAAAGELFDKNTVKSWMFNSSTLQVDENNGSANKLGLVVGLVAGILVLIMLFGILAFILWWKKKKVGNKVGELGFSMSMNHEFEISPIGPRKFSYLELARATDNFAEKEKLGEGSFGGVYKGMLKDLSTYVAVKRVSKTSKQGIKEYASEVRIISRLRHKNLVQLNGWCHEKGELLLVYEYMENGSLDSHLFKAKSLLAWETRYQIVIGLASAILYLHEEWEQCVLHRDIKSSNVMLDSNFNAKLGDFGLAKFVDHEKGSQTTILAGTLGYMAPECITTGKASKESDVFSFGVVALEIVCGRKSIDYKGQEKHTWLPEWIWELYGDGTFLEAVDPRLGLEFDEDEVKRMMIVGLWCVHPDSKLRPSIRQVIQVLNSEASLPVLPINMPVASYFTTGMPSLFGGSNVDLSTSSSYLDGR